MVRIDHFGPHEVHLTTGRYTNGRIAVQLIENGEPYATVSVNVPEAPIGDDEFFVKNYSENEGLLEELLRVGLLEFTGRFVDAGGLGSLPVFRLGVIAH